MKPKQNTFFYVALCLTAFALVYLLASCSEDDGGDGQSSRDIATSAFGTMIVDADELTEALSSMDVATGRELAYDIAGDFDALVVELEAASDADTPEGQRFIEAAEVCSEAFGDLAEGLDEVNVAKIETASERIGVCTEQVTGLAD